MRLGSPATGNSPIVTAAEMTDALVEINDRLADAGRGRGDAGVTFFCECGECLAEEVPLLLDEHEEIRVREDLIFAPGHDAPRRYRQPKRQMVDPAAAATDFAGVADRLVLLALPRHAGRLRDL